MGVNNFHAIGRVGQDPRLHETKSGKKVCNFSIATSDNYKKGDDWKTATEWHDVTVWNEKAEYLAENLRKGTKVYVEGPIKTEEYKDGDTTKKKKYCLLRSYEILERQPS